MKVNYRFHKNKNLEKGISAGRVGKRNTSNSLPEGSRQKWRWACGRKNRRKSETPKLQINETEGKEKIKK